VDYQTHYPYDAESHYNENFGVVHHRLTKLAKAHNGDLFGAYIRRRDGAEGHLLLEVNTIGNDIIVQVCDSQFPDIIAHARWYITLASLSEEFIAVGDSNPELVAWCQELHRALRWAINEEKEHLQGVRDLHRTQQEQKPKRMRLVGGTDAVQSFSLSMLTVAGKYRDEATCVVITTTPTSNSDFILNVTSCGSRQELKGKMVRSSTICPENLNLMSMDPLAEFIREQLTRLTGGSEMAA
jgi:hypothetical protein